LTKFFDFGQKLPIFVEKYHFSDIFEIKMVLPGHRNFCLETNFSKIDQYVPVYFKPQKTLDAFGENLGKI
jgi:hypothetical protein